MYSCTMVKFDAQTRGDPRAACTAAGLRNGVPPDEHISMRSFALLLSSCAAAHALLCAPARGHLATARRIAAARMDFGDSFYEGFDKWAAEYPQEDRDTYPELFKLPDNCYEVILDKPLGIAFEEVQPGQGVVVDYLVEGSNAAQCGRIQPGDILVAVTAYKVAPISSRLPCLSPCLAVYLPILHPPVLPPCASIHRARPPVSPPPSLPP